MPIDPSIPLQAQAPGVDPLAVAAGAVQLRNMLTQGQVAQQELRARQALGPIYQGAIDDKGNLDSNKLLQGVRGSSDAAFMAGDIAQQALARKGQEVTIQGQQLEQALARRKAVNLALASTLQGGGGPQQAVESLAGLVQDGVIDQDYALQAASQIPEDPQQYRPWATKMFIDGLDEERKLEAVWGSPQVFDAGGRQIILSVSPNPGSAPRQIGSIEKTLSPGEATQLVEVVNPDGSKSFVTRGSIVGSQPQGVQQPGASGAARNGRYPGAAGPITALPPGEGEALTEAATGSAKSYQALRNDVTSSAERIFQLQEARKALANATTGKGSQGLQDFKSALVTFGIDPSQAESVKNFDEAKKYLTQTMLSRGADVGVNTDSKLATLAGGSPNVEISNMAAKDMVKAAIGLERMRQAQVAAFQATGQSPSKYSDWATTWNRSVDPRGFMADQLEPAERASLTSKMTDVEFKRYVGAIRAAIDAGVYTKDDLR